MLRSPRKSELSRNASLKRSRRRWTRLSLAFTLISRLFPSTQTGRRSGRTLDQRLAADLALQLDDGIDEGFGPRRAAGEIDGDRHHLVHPLDDRLVVQQPGGKRAGAPPHPPLASP